MLDILKNSKGFKMTRLGSIVCVLLMAGAFSGCKYYGSALPPDYPMSMDIANDIARDRSTTGSGVPRAIERRQVRPRVEQPSYLPEKELALVAPPRTLLVWSYPHVTDDNTRVFGNWSTIFLNERYEWVRPSNEVPESDMLGAGSTFSAPLGVPNAPVR